MNLWQPSRKGETIRDVVLHNTGLTEEEFFHPKALPVKNLDAAAALILSHLRNGEPITIVGDYDCDGVTASSILYLLLRRLGRESCVRLPRRFSEGYGMSPAIVDEIESGLIVAVDNGISAIEAVREAKRKGLSVLILDHHLPAETLPDADVIVDPHVHGDAFCGYCGAGLAFRLALELLSEEDRAMRNAMAALAAIGTIADVMPLTGYNRVIVQGGLQVMNNPGFLKNYIPGLASLIEAAEMESFNETDVAFSLAPMINAAGRLLDNGAEIAFQAIVSGSPEQARKLTEINEERKKEVAAAVESAKEIMAEGCLYGEVPLCVCLPGINEGVIGIIAGKLSEEFKVPSFVFTDKDGIWKGSGRSYGGYNLKNLLDRSKSLLLNYGGHEGAAGLSLIQTDYDAWKLLVMENASDYVLNDVNTVEYDLEITPDEISESIRELQKYAPFGEGNPRPVFLIRSMALSPRQGAFYKVMGKEGEHLKLFGPKCSCVGFGMSEKYKDDAKYARILDLVGMLGTNTFLGRTENQIELLDFRKTERAGAQTGLAAILAEKMKAF